MQLISITEILDKHRKSQKKIKAASNLHHPETLMVSPWEHLLLFSATLTKPSLSSGSLLLEWHKRPKEATALRGKPPPFIPLECDTTLVTKQSRTPYSNCSEEWRLQPEVGLPLEGAAARLQTLRGYTDGTAVCKATLPLNENIVLHFHLCVRWDSVHSDKAFLSNGVLSSPESLLILLLNYFSFYDLKIGEKISNLQLQDIFQILHYWQAASKLTAVLTSQCQTYPLFFASRTRLNLWLLIQSNWKKCRKNGALLW